MTIYWDYQDTGATSFNDETRIATEYDATGALIGERPYSESENTRADQAIAVAAVETARLDYVRAVGLGAPDELAALQAAILAAEGIEEGDPWRQPSGAHDAYPLGAVVSHQEKTWESTVAANVWEPGVSGWMEAGPGIPDWVQPTGAHDAYPAGAIVRHLELVWSSNVDGNVWEPPEQWTEISEP